MTARTGTPGMTGDGVRTDFVPVSRHPPALEAPECRVPSTKWVGDGCGVAAT